MNLEPLQPIIHLSLEEIKSNPELFVKFSKAYTEAFGSSVPEICGTCPDGLDTAFAYAHSIYRKVSKQKSTQMKNNSRFLLKDIDGVPTTIWSLKQHRYISNANLTDEIAFALLAESANHISLFEKYPADWNAPAKSPSKKGDGKKVDLAPADPATSGAAGSADAGTGTPDPAADEKKVELTEEQRKTKENDDFKVALSEMTVPVLKERCGKYPVADWKDLKKDDLVNFIFDREKPNAE